MNNFNNLLIESSIKSRTDEFSKFHQETQRKLLELRQSLARNQDSDLIWRELFADEEVESDSRLCKEHVENFHTNTVSNFTEDEFSLHFRMRRKSFKILVNILKPLLPSLSSLENKVLYTIYMLGHNENLRLGSSKFGLPLTTGHNAFKTVVTALVSLIPTYIKWPTSEQRSEISSRFEITCGIPGIVGAIDGCHIPIKQPVGNPIDYYNRKQYHSALLQGTCDDRMLFIDIAAGDPGRMHDAKMFKESPLGRTLATNHSSLLDSSQHIIGDCAYPNNEQVVTPFKNTGRLTAEQKSFNTRLCTGRVIIENAFGQLKGKFRRLKYLDMNDMDLCIKVIAASCVLHNFIITEKDDSPHVISVDSDDDPYTSDFDRDGDEDESFSRTQKAKRLQLMGDLRGKPPSKNIKYSRL